MTRNRKKRTRPVMHSIKTTVDIYGHLVPGSNREAVNRLPSKDGIQSVELKVKKR